MSDAAFKIGDKVRVIDPVSFYRGRVGVIASEPENRIGFNVYTVHVPSATGNATISMACREAYLVLVEPEKDGE
jgi:hypothetical protein